MSTKFILSSLIFLCLVDNCLSVCCYVGSGGSGSSNASNAVVLPKSNKISNDAACSYTTCPQTDNYCVTLYYRNYKMDSKHIWSNYFVLFDCPSTIGIRYPQYNFNVSCTNTHTSGYVNVTSSNSQNIYPLTDYGYNCCTDDSFCDYPKMPGLNGSPSNVQSHLLILCIVSIFMAMFKEQ